MHFPPKFLGFLQKKIPPLFFFMVHLLHRLYGVDAPGFDNGNGVNERGYKIKGPH